MCTERLFEIENSDVYLLLFLGMEFIVVAVDKNKVKREPKRKIR
jgi:hypothetical protein